MPLALPATACSEIIGIEGPPFADFLSQCDYLVPWFHLFLRPLNPINLNPEVEYV
jgi:hypothetical protein